RAAVDHSPLLKRGHPATDQLCHFHFKRIRDAKTNPPLRCIAHRANDFWMRVSNNRRPPTTDIVDQLTTIDCPNVRPLSAIGKKRFATHAPKRPYRRVHATGNSFLRASKKFCGAAAHSKAFAPEPIYRHRPLIQAPQHRYCPLANWRGSQVVRSRSAKPLFAGSIPAPAFYLCGRVAYSESDERNSVSENRSENNSASRHIEVCAYRGRLAIAVRHRRSDQDDC